MGRVPFNKPFLVGTEVAYIQQAVEAMHLSGDGSFTRRCHERLETLTGARQALLTTSCTHALELCALLLDLAPGDEVIVPAFTFVSTANAFVLRGAVPVFADVRFDTLNIDETAIEALITPRTRAIVVVHYAGVACEMDTILAIGARHRVTVIEDNCATGSSAGIVHARLGASARSRRSASTKTKEHQLRRGRCAPDQRPGTGAAGGDSPGEGYEPRRVLPGARGSVLVGRPGIELPPVRHSRRVPLGANSKRPTGFSSGDMRSGAATPSGSRRGPLRRASGCLTFRRTASTRRTCSISCCPRRPIGSVSSRT